MSTAASPVATQGSLPASPPDWVAERTVLGHLLDQHPRRLTLFELTDEISGDLEETTIRRAVDNLVAARFLLRDDAELTPAPAVVDFERTAATVQASS